MTTRANIVTTEEITVGVLNGNLAVTMVNGEAKDIRLLLGNYRVRFCNEAHLVEIQRAIGEVLGAVEKARARFDWVNLAYIEEDGVRVV